MQALVRYVVFALVGLVVASTLFFVLNFLISANYETGVSFIERWIVRATCDQYRLEGTIRDASGRPVQFALIEVTYLDDRLTTRSLGDGSFRIEAAEPVCDRAPPANVGVLVVAEGFRPKRQAVPAGQDTVELTLDARDFRP